MIGARYEAAVIGVALMVAGGAGPSLADTQPRALEQLEALVVELAETPGQHRALARYFRARAAEHRSLARAHHDLARAYASSRRDGSQAKVKHCERLAILDERLADEYEALAAVHERASGS